MTFMFWNLHNNPETFPIINCILDEYDVDICILTEYPQNDISSYSIKEGYLLYTSPSVNHKMYFIHKKDINLNIGQDIDNRMSLRNISLDNEMKINLISCHLHDKIYNPEEDRKYIFRHYSNKIIEFEEEKECDNTIIVGDLNIDPYDTIMFSADIFNTTMNKKIARNIQRRFQGHDYKYFYNPMWKFFNDSNYLISGTYYYSKNQLVSYKWHIFDQVLIRPSLIRKFDEDKLKIITTVSSYRLLKNNGAINKNISDHLPIVFSINL